MRPHSRLKHAAAALANSLISRNNDVNGHWAPGLLYQNVLTPPCIIEVDLLGLQSIPPSQSAAQMAANTAAFPRTALAKHNIPWTDLAIASITFQFNAPVQDPNFHFPCLGDPFTCQVTLQTIAGRPVAVSVQARCHPYDYERYSASTYPNRHLDKIS